MFSKVSLFSSLSTSKQVKCLVSKCWGRRRGRKFSLAVQKSTEEMEENNSFVYVCSGPENHMIRECERIIDAIKLQTPTYQMLRTMKKCKKERPEVQLESPQFTLPLSSHEGQNLIEWHLRLCAVFLALCYTCICSTRPVSLQLKGCKLARM